MKKLLILVCMLFLVAGCRDKEYADVIVSDVFGMAEELSFKEEGALGIGESIETAFRFTFEGTEYYILPEELGKMSKEEFQDLALYQQLCLRMFPTQESFKNTSELFLPSWVTERDEPAFTMAKLQECEDEEIRLTDPEGDIVLGEEVAEVFAIELKDENTMLFFWPEGEDCFIMETDMRFWIEEKDKSSQWIYLPKGSKIYFYEGTQTESEVKE